MHVLGCLLIWVERACDDSILKYSEVSFLWMWYPLGISIHYTILPRKEWTLFCLRIDWFRSIEWPLFCLRIDRFRSMPENGHMVFSYLENNIYLSNNFFFQCTDQDRSMAIKRTCFIKCSIFVVFDMGTKRMVNSLNSKRK